MDKITREDFLQQFGEDAWTLFEGFMDHSRAANAIAEQLRKHHGVSVGCHTEGSQSFNAIVSCTAREDMVELVCSLPVKLVWKSGGWNCSDPATTHHKIPRGQWESGNILLELQTQCLRTSANQ